MVDEKNTVDLPEETSDHVDHDGDGPAEHDFDADRLPPDDFDSFATDEVEKEEDQ